MPQQFPGGPAVGFSGVTKRFGDGTIAVDGVSLEVAGGSFVALVGASGSGKSTLLKTVNRLVTPSDGTVTLDGADVADEPPHLLRRRIGYVFQNVGLFPHLSVGENIALPLKLAGRRDPARVAAMLDLVELPRALAERMPAALSGGQRQRVGVARALVTQPGLLLMDEPFGALDPVTRESLAAAVARLHRDLRLTTIMVTHDMAEALLTADRVLVMEKGRIVADATPAALLAGEGGAAADALVAVPRAQADRLDRIGGWRMSNAFARVPELAAQHLLLAMAALALALAAGLPLGVWSARSPRVAGAVLGAASLVQTIPSLALLALFYPLLLWIGHGIPALGFLPALLALTLYALLPIVRNLVTGLNGLDPAITEAADGIGMTPAQKLRLVEAPLVLPIVMAGIRTAAVWTIGAATLSTTVGQPSLGDLIFAGLQTQAWTLVIAGCVSAAALALAVDALLGLAERAAGKRRWRVVWIALGVLAAATLAASAPFWMRGGDEKRVVIGAKNFSEQYILARLIGDRLEKAGYRVEYRDGLGSAVAFGAVSGGEIDAYVDYAGTIWTAEMKRTDAPGREKQVAAIAQWAKKSRGVTLLGSLGFENAYAFAMRGADARAKGIATLDDLVGAAPELAFGADLEFLDRPEWAAIRRAYPLRFASATPYAPTFMYRALESRRADVISAFSSDGRIAADRLTVLRDPKHAIPGYDAILLLSPRRAGDARFAAALRPLVGRIPVEAMREANYMVDRDTGKVSPEAAAAWLAKRVGLEE